MPELPEVETVVRNLRPDLVGRQVQSVWYDWDNVIRTPAHPEFIARMEGRRILALRRRAKYIVAELDEGLLMVHLKMTGRLYVASKDVVHDADRWVHFRLGLDDGRELRFSDSRKFGRVYLTDAIEDVTGELGPEPLTDDFTAAIFTERMAGRSKNIKALLLDQSFIAGVGNIYADESLHRAGIHPLRRVNSLSADETKRLYQTVRQSLQDGINHEGASINWYRKPDGSKGSSQNHFFVYGRTGQSCHHCGHLVEKIRVAQRGTHFCPICQPIEGT